MHIRLPLRVLGFGLAAVLLASGGSHAQAPAAAPTRDVRADASAACEAAVLASFQRARGHANDQLNFQPAQRKTRIGAKKIVSATGAATYTKTGKPVKLTYRCTYDSKASKVTSSRWR